MNREDALCILIDYQTKMAPAIHDTEALEKKLIRAVKAFQVLDIPVLVTQHYTKGLGETTDALREALGDFTPIEKITFSCMQNEEFLDTVKKSSRKTVIITGVETHICVQQTALQLLEAGYNVYILEDCCSSRFARDHETGIRRMENAGIKITSSESAFFELMRSAKFPRFKEISNLVK